MEQHYEPYDSAGNKYGELSPDRLTPTNHQHTYVDDAIGPVCSQCWLLKSTIEAVAGRSAPPQVEWEYIQNTPGLQAILDELATAIHNLSPGDVGSFERVLVPIERAKRRVEALIIKAKVEAYEELVDVPHAEYANPHDAAYYLAVKRLAELQVGKEA